MAYSSVKAMLNVSRQNNQPLWDVILQSDLLESGLTRPQSLAEMHHLWQVMVQTSDNYCGADRSASGFAGGDAAKVAEAEARGQLLTGGYLAQVMAEALKTAGMQRLHETNCRRAHGGQLRRSARGAAALCGAAAAITRKPSAARCMSPPGLGRLWPRAHAGRRRGRLPGRGRRCQRHGSRRPGGAARRHRRTMRRSLCHGADQPGGPCV